MKEKNKLSRLFEATGANTDKEFAEKIGISPQAVYEAKRRNKIPDAWIKITAEKTGISADWLFFARGPKRLTEQEHLEEEKKMLEKEILLKALEDLEEAESITNTVTTGKKREKALFSLYDLRMSKKEPSLADYKEIIAFIAGINSTENTEQK
ncbi:MAG: hypothetical protein EOM23_07250 [Candidatus Moranbacteria bacterium]|nr:hypothetical protein [Candidatus Moranbacteria bacterium]